MWESRVAPLSGLLFTVLLVARFIVDPNTDFMPPETDVVAYLQEGPIQVMTGAYLGLLAAAALLWFSGSVYHSLREGDRDEARLAVLALGGGVTAAALFTVASVALIAAAERVFIAGSIELGAAAALFDVSGIAVGNGAAIGLAVMIAAWGMATIRDNSRPRWHGGISLLLALGLLSPYAWAVLAAALIWTSIVGISLYRAPSRRRLSEVS